MIFSFCLFKLFFLIFIKNYVLLWTCLSSFRITFSWHRKLSVFTSLLASFQLFRDHFYELAQFIVFRQSMDPFHQVLLALFFWHQSSCLLFCHLFFILFCHLFFILFCPPSFLIFFHLFFLILEEVIGVSFSQESHFYVCVFFSDVRFGFAPFFTYLYCGFCRVSIYLPCGPCDVFYVSFGNQTWTWSVCVYVFFIFWSRCCVNV